MSSNDQIPAHCDHETCKIQLQHCHICDNGSCGLDQPHCHVCLHQETNEPVASRRSLAPTRNNTQPDSVKHQAELFQQMRTEEGRRNTEPNLGDTPPEVAYHSAQWQPSYAVGGGTDLMKMLRPTGHRTFSWGGPGSSITIPSPEGSRSSSAPESRGEEPPKRPKMPQPQSSRMREVLRRRLDDRPLSAYGSERGIGTTPLMTPPPGTPTLRGSPIGWSPVTASPVRTPPGDKAEVGGEGTNGKRPRIGKGIGKGAFKGLKKARKISK